MKGSPVMDTKDTMRLTTNVTVTVNDALTGHLVSQFVMHNLVVAGGLNLVRDALNGTGACILTHIAVGTNATAVVSGQNALVAEVNRGGISQRTPAAGTLTVQRFLGSQDANGNTLVEAGLYCGSVMFGRVVFPAVAKTSGFTMTITWAVNIGTP